MSEKKRPNIVLQMNPLQTITVIGMIQLALRHPDNIRPSTEVAQHIVKGLIEILAKIHPNLEIIAEAGWHQEYDNDNDTMLSLLREAGETIDLNYRT